MITEASSFNTPFVQSRRSIVGLAERRAMRKRINIRKKGIRWTHATKMISCFFRFQHANAFRIFLVIFHYARAAIEVRYAQYLQFTALSTMRDSFVCWSIRLTLCMAVLICGACRNIFYQAAEAKIT